MSINNVNHLRYLQNLRNGILSRENTSSDTSQQISVSTSNPIGSAYYRQYLVGNSNVNFTGLGTSVANGSDEILHKIFELDREAFAETDPYDDYDEFLSRIEDNNLTAYAVKDTESGEILGYYQLEPIRNGDLYIDSMALAPEFRRTRRGVQAIRYAWEQIQNYARENGVQTMSLHVDATNEALVNLYKNFGFTVKETYENYFAQGQRAYYMELDLANQVQPEVVEEVSNSSTDTEAVQSEETILEPQIEERTVEVLEEPVVPVEPTRAELRAKELQQKIEASEILKEKGIKGKYERESILKGRYASSVYGHHDYGGNEVFDAERFKVELEIIDLGKELGVDLYCLRKFLIGFDGGWYLRRELIPFVKQYINSEKYKEDTSWSYLFEAYIINSNIPQQSKDIVLQAVEKNSLNANALNIIYSAQIEEFIQRMDVPDKNKDIVRKYLLQANLQKHIVRPRNIETQLENLDKSANQILMNPNIPLEKKLAYIEEYKVKKADMIANSDKYITPYINEKPLNNLRNMVEAYINIPNDDAKFNNCITESMYLKFGIDTTTALLEDIRYDIKYFDKLFSAGSDFGENFKRLITLVKLNPKSKLMDIRMIMPEVGTTEYELYKSVGLIEQIKANQTTKQAFLEHNLNFDKWNSYDENLHGEVFDVEVDKETSLANAKSNFINEMNGELFNQISNTETENLKKYLTEHLGVVFFNNKIYKGQSEINPNYVETIIDAILKYKEENEIWNGSKVAEGFDRNAMEGFIDHLNSIKTKLSQLKNARNVEGLYLRLSDENDIGRNIFFGNHVSCCNSVESPYAGYSAPLHLMNCYNRGIEIVDSRGNSYGNSRCFFAEVDGKLTFIIDSFEANGKLGSNPIVTEMIIKFAKQVCEEMGRGDAQIMFGPNYNNIDLSSLHSSCNHTIKPVGCSACKTYCDSLAVSNGKVIVRDEVQNKTMYRVEV